MIDYKYLALVCTTSLSIGFCLYWSIVSIQEWLANRKFAKQQKEAYVKHLYQECQSLQADLRECEEENNNLTAQIRSTMCRELTWMDERKTLLKRIAFLVGEIQMDDPNKLTTLFRP